MLAPTMGYAPGDPSFDKLRYGIHVFYINTIKTLGLIIVALALGILPYVMVFALALGALRCVSFGIHLKSSFFCTIMGLVYYLGSVYLSLYVAIPLLGKIVVLLVCAGCFAAYAPAQTNKRPIPPHQKRALKGKSLIVLTAISITVLLLGQYPVFSNLIFMAAVCQTINLLPITYRLLKES